MPSLFRKHPFAVAISVFAHLLLIAFLVLGLDFFETKAAPVVPVNTVKATVIDSAKIKAAAEKLKAAEQKKKRLEQKRLDDIKKKRLNEQKKLKALEKKQRDKKAAIEKEKVAEAARLAKIKKQKAVAKKKLEQAKKKAAADKKRKAEAKRKRDIAEQQKKLAAAKQRKQEQQLIEQRFREELEREEQEMRAQDALASFSGAIRQKVERNWNQPAGSAIGLKCKVRVKLIPGGEVVDVRVVKSSGNALFDRSVELATEKASPLPTPSEPSLFKYFRDIEFMFDPEAN